MRRFLGFAALVPLLLASASALAQDAAAIAINDAGYFEGAGVNILAFSNSYDGLFADSKIGGIEIIQQGLRSATNGDVRLSPTPGQWDPVAIVVKRSVDKGAGTIETRMRYSELNWDYVVCAERKGTQVVISVILDKPVPKTLVGKAGFNLEFLPSAYFHHSYLADATTGIFPRYPADRMTVTAERNAASGRSEGPGAEPMPIAKGSRFVLAPEDPARRITVSGDAPIMLYDGRNQAQNGWFVLRSMLPVGKVGTVLQWNVDVNAVTGWLRTPVIAHSQLGYLPGGTKVATVELDRNDAKRAPIRLLRIGDRGAITPVATGPAREWGDYLRYHYLQLDFSAVTQPGLYMLEYGDVRTAPFRIARDVYANAWHPTNDVYFPVAMDHMSVNEAYRSWHGDSHRDDGRQAPLNHEHIDLYRQGPTTDTPYKPGEHIPGLNVGGWYDAGDFDIRTQSQYEVIRSLVESRELYGLDRDTVSVDYARRHVEMHVPDGKPDIVQQVAHGTIQLLAQFDAVGHAIHGIVEPDVAQYTHLGDAVNKTDGLVYDPALKVGEVRNGRSGTPDDRWVFTSKSSALNYGAIAGLAAAARVLKGQDDALATRALTTAEKAWGEEQTHAPDIFVHGNTTGGPLDAESFAAAVELLRATGKRIYADRVMALWPGIAKNFRGNAVTAAAAIPFMPASYRAAMEPMVRQWAKDSEAAARANPFGVPITTGGWAGSGTVMGFALTSAALHRAFPDIVSNDAVYRGIAFMTGHHPGSDISFVSAVGTKSKEVAYGNNRADFSFIAGGVVPGVLVVKPDFPENHEDWPFFWGENEYVIPEGAAWIDLVNAADRLGKP
ncbi:glycoside hydrolase family 9 protein [Sphingobium sp.]|uniref:glycoside hydrolase family 9 protein n=1 Tax=Sphingobium sp. TaxID=1912891 RepID=UPI003BB7CCB7